MASPTRRVLSPLNVNSPLTRSLGEDTNSLTKPPNMGAVLSLPASVTDQFPIKTQIQATMGGEKRNVDDAQDGRGVFPSASASAPEAGSEEGPCRKKSKTVHGASEGGFLAQEELGLQTGVGGQELDTGREFGRGEGRDGRCFRDGDGRSALSSPSSCHSSPSNFSTPAALDDSQQTVLTEPDDAPLPATATSFRAAGPTADIASLSKEELRERANALKLRLRLATYKVHTNQINTPLSQLQIRTSSSLPPRQKRTPLPTTAAPSILLQHPSSENKTEHIPSSPPTHQSPPPRRGEDDGFATPILPRQRHGLLNPPILGTPMGKSGLSNEDLTSSVVKGRAADGLLSLLRHMQDA